MNHENKILVKYTVRKDARRDATIFTFTPNLIYRHTASHMEMALSRCESFRQAMYDSIASAFRHALYELQDATVDFDLDAEQMAALDAITRRQGERYFDYIQRVKQNEMAKTVKLADLQNNIRRCAEDLPNRWDLIRRYAKAYGILIGECGEM